MLIYNIKFSLIFFNTSHNFSQNYSHCDSNVLGMTLLLNVIIS